MESRTHTWLRLLDYEPVTLWLLADLTGVPPATIEGDLRYLERFGMVDERQGYWVHPEKLRDDGGEHVRAVG